MARGTKTQLTGDGDRSATVDSKLFFLSSEDVSAEIMGNIEQNDKRSNNYISQIQDLRMFLMDKLP